MTKRYNGDVLWAGKEASFYAYVEAQSQIEAGPLADPGQTSRDGGLPQLLEIAGNVGIIQMKGPMSNYDSWRNQLKGITSYGAIREALVAAAAHPDVQQIVLDIDSGGGSVNGVSDVSNLIGLVNSKVKPVTSFTSGAMLSAAYWLGSSAGEVYASNVSSVGSIGVIMVHTENSQMLKAEGINATVMRAGKYKALANSVEPLTTEAKVQIQSQLDAAYQIFVQHVAEARGTTYPHADSAMAQGREFIGQQAVDAGLVDGIMTFDDLMSKLNAKTIDTNTQKDNNASNFGGTTFMKNALTEQAIAAIAAGAPVLMADAPTVEVIAGDTAITEPVVAAAEVVGNPAAPVAAANPEIVAFLQGQVKDLSDSLLNATVDLKVMTDKLDGAESTAGPLLDIARKSVANMQVALGGSSLDLSGMPAASILTEHTRLSDAFGKKFKEGGIAALDAAASDHEPVAPGPLHAARIKATRAQRASK